MFFVFTWDTFYPEGGMNDLIASCDSLAEAMQIVTDRSRSRDWWQIASIDVYTGKLEIVAGN